MKSSKRINQKENSWIQLVKGNATWVVSLLTIVGTIFGVGRWSASLNYKVELNANNAKHYQEIVTLREEHMKELLKLQSEKMDLQNELTFLKSKLEKEVNHE